LSTMPRPKLSPSLLKRPTAETKFHIDYDWWEQSNLDLKTYLFSRLPVSEETASINTEAELVDLIDMNTGEVRRVDGFQYLVQTYFRQLPDDFASRMSLVDAVFCVLLAGGNQPMTAQEIAERVTRPVETILRTFGGPKVYQGIRPLFDDE
jgi:hypothetical protein